MGVLVRARRRNGLRVEAGQELTHLSLKPGEEIRTPLIAMLFWRGTDVVRGAEPLAALVHRAQHAAGRRPDAAARHARSRWTARAEHRLRQAVSPGGHPARTSAGATPAPGARPGIRAAAAPTRASDAWLNTGTWEIDPAKYPQGIQAVQRLGPCPRNEVRPVVRAGTGGRPGNRGWARTIPNGCCRARRTGALLNEGNPAALNWLIDHVDGMIKSQGIDWYREDMNGGGPAARLAQERRRRSPGDHGEPLRARAPGVLGRTATPKSRPAHRFLRLRRAAQRSGDHAAGRAAVAQRFPVPGHEGRRRRATRATPTGSRSGCRFRARVLLL